MRPPWIKVRGKSKNECPFRRERKEDIVYQFKCHGKIQDGVAYTMDLYFQGSTAWESKMKDTVAGL